ncbi:hypothetical protein CsSME_00017082 [Camellia sinensis var. sinensis]
MTSLSGDFFGIIFLILLCFTGSVAGATQFDFETLTLTSLKLLGDAHLNNGSPETHFPASFSTFFSFSVTNLNPSSIGGGLAFLISPDDSAVGDGGAYLGLMNQTGGPIGTVAVEFDTLMDVQFMDINGNHNPLMSISKAATWSTRGSITPGRLGSSTSLFRTPISNPKLHSYHSLSISIST